MRLFYGDCLKVMPVLPEESVDLIVTSPPYNVGKNYRPRGINPEMLEGWEEIGGDFMPWLKYYERMDMLIRESYRVLSVGGIIAINVPPHIRYMRDHPYCETWWDYAEMPTHRDNVPMNGRGRIEPVGYKLLFAMQKHFLVREPVVWVKGGEEGEVMSNNTMAGSDNNPYFRSCHELILIGSKGQYHTRGGTGKRGKEYQPYLDLLKDVWWMKPESHQVHPAVFPEELPRRLIQIFTQPGWTVLDPFMGVGTTGKACKALERDFIGIEGNPSFFHIAERTLEQQSLFEGENHGKSANVSEP